MIVRTRCWYVMFRKCGELLYGVSFKAERDCLHDLYKSMISLMKRSMVPERKRDFHFAKERGVHGESNMWSTVLS